MRWLRSFCSLLFIQILCLGFLSILGPSVSAQSPVVGSYSFPPNDIGIETLAKRKAAQLATENQFKVFYRFHFTNEVKESGITFRYQVVDDELQNWKPTHYDHGSAVAVADVDGDGLYDIRRCV